MSLESELDPIECIHVFESAVSKRPLKLKALPFSCDRPQIGSTSSSIEAGFQLGEPYGILRMDCAVRNGTTVITFSTSGNLRGRALVNILAKHES